VFATSCTHGRDLAPLAFLSTPPTTSDRAKRLAKVSTGALGRAAAYAPCSDRSAPCYSAARLTTSTPHRAEDNGEPIRALTGRARLGLQGGFTAPRAPSYLIGRYYDPATGQFLSVDPEVEQTLAAYVYAADNPVNSCDPSGQRDCKQLASKIISVAQEAAKRYDQILANALNLPLTGPYSVATHQKAFVQAQNRLRNLLDQWDRSGCGGRGETIPQNVRELARVPVPWPDTRTSGFRITSNEVIGGFVLGALVVVGFLTGGIADVVFAVFAL
jgi:RHS repeat-associated protein